MNLQAQRDLSIAGDVVGRDKITINLTRGLDELPTRYDGRVQNFLEYYLGTQEHPAPFGGRASDLAVLNTWLNDPTAPRYAALVAPAGRGKSALLAHWITHLLARFTTNDQQSTTNDKPIHVVYFPISIRFNTNLETVAFASLAARMAHIYGEKVTQATDAQQYRGVFCDYLRRTPPNNGRVLVVLDGLDEAAGWEAGADLFPTIAPDHLRVLVAARPLALDKDETAWLNRLGWETPNPTQRLTLAGLDREGVRDVLTQMGNPLDALATRIDLISRLYDLSEGDPLFVRLYVEALLPYGEQAAVFDPEDLATLQPGLKNYFDLWFEQQQKLWDKLGKPIPEEAVFGILYLCATALGPLKKDDALMLAPNELKNSWTLEKAVRAVNRFIIGEGDKSGYVFSHPRLAEYFAAKLTDRERQAWQARFLQYGRDTLAALENKTLLPKNAPAYAVQYYSAHLAQANAPATDLYALVCEIWLRAWEWLEGTPTGFLNDADRAWQKAEAEGPAALGQQIRAALCFASVTSLSANIPKDLLVACVKAGVISPALGLVMARQKPDPQDRAECLAAIAEFHPSESQAIVSEALAAARAISHESIRAEVLKELAPRLQETIAGEALALTRTISDERIRAKALKELAPRLQESLAREALALTRTISDEGYRAGVLGKLAPHLPEREQAIVIEEALSVARAISDEGHRASVLGELVRRLPEREQAIVIEEALSAARAIADERLRTQVLCDLTPHLPRHQQENVLENVLPAIIPNPYKWRSSADLNKLAPLLSAMQLREALSIVGAISHEFGERASGLEALVPWLPENLLGEALSTARTISDERDRVKVLRALARRLPESEKAEVLREALSASRAIFDEYWRVDVLCKLAPQLTKLQEMEVLDEALSTTRVISDLKFRAEVLDELARRLPGCERADVLEEALAAARAVSDEKDRAHVLGALAPSLPERVQTDVFSEALSAASRVLWEQDRAPVLSELASQLPESLLERALSIARAISNESFRAEVLSKLVPRFPEPKKAEVLRETFSAALKISNDERQARVLGELAPRLPESLLKKALGALSPRLSDILFLKKAMRETQRSLFANIRPHILMALVSYLPERLLKDALLSARAIFNPQSRAEVLMELAPRLPEHKQAEVQMEALSAARAISYKEPRADVLGKLAPRLPEREKVEVLMEALTSARAIPDEKYRVKALVKIVPWLLEHEQTEVLREALSAARAISDEESRAKILVELALTLPEREQVEVLGEAFTVASAISHEKSRFDVLVELAPRLPESLLGEALQMTRTSRHYQGIIAALSSLAPRWSAVCHSTQRTEFEELSATLRAFARTKRPQLLQAIQALLPVIAEQGGQQALRETARAIVDTANWWP